MQPPPALPASQNQALCGPGMGLPAAHPQHVADRPGAHGRQRLQRLRACRRGPRGSRRRRPADSTRSRIRLASSAVRASGLVHSTALPAAAAAAIASSCMSLGRPTTTVSTSGSLTASSMLVVARGTSHRSLERLAPLDRTRVDDLDTVAAAPAVQRHRVEVADQSGAEHGDAMVHGQDSRSPSLSSVRSSSVRADGETFNQELTGSLSGGPGAT